MLIPAKAAAYPIANMKAPPEGAPLALVYPVAFDGTGQPVRFDLMDEITERVIDCVQTVFIDNSANAASVRLQFDQFQIALVVPANKQAWLPVLAAAYPTFTMSTATVNIVIPMCFYNVPMPSIIY
jgi:hypothetical protein